MSHLKCFLNNTSLYEQTEMNRKFGEQTISPSPLGNTGGALKTFLFGSFWSKFGMNDQIQPNLSSDVQINPSSKPSVVIIFDPSSTKSIGNAPPFTAAGEIFVYAANDQKMAKNSVSNRKQ